MVEQNIDKIQIFSEKKIDMIIVELCRNIVLNKGLNPIDSCEVFEEVTIVFSDVPDFMDICSKCEPFQIVNLLNTMFGLFDYLSDKNDIYKLETVKDSFVGVRSSFSVLNFRSCPHLACDLSQAEKKITVVTS